KKADKRQSHSTPVSIKFWTAGYFIVLIESFYILCGRPVPPLGLWLFGELAWKNGAGRRRLCRHGFWEMRLPRTGRADTSAFRLAVYRGDGIEGSDRSE